VSEADRPGGSTSSGQDPTPPEVVSTDAAAPTGDAGGSQTASPTQDPTQAETPDATPSSAVTPTADEATGQPEQTSDDPPSTKAQQSGPGLDPPGESTAEEPVPAQGPPRAG
jgi:hypothetical protein